MHWGGFCYGYDAIQVIESVIRKWNVISSLPPWMKSWVHYFLIKWGLEVHEFRETFIFDRSRLITNSLSNLQVICNVHNSGFACHFSHRRNLTRQRSYHSRYQTKGCLIGGILLNSGVALIMFSSMNKWKHCIHWYQFPLSLLCALYQCRCL